MITDRRSLLLTGLAGILTASAGPAIIRVSSLMAIRPLPVLLRDGALDFEILQGETAMSFNVTLRYAVTGKVIGQFVSKNAESAWNDLMINRKALQDGEVIKAGLIEAVRA